MVDDAELAVVLFEGIHVTRSLVQQCLDHLGFQQPGFSARAMVVGRARSCHS